MVALSRKTVKHRTRHAAGAPEAHVAIMNAHSWANDYNHIRVIASTPAGQRVGWTSIRGGSESSTLLLRVVVGMKGMTCEAASEPAIHVLGTFNQ